MDGPLDYRRLSLPWSCCSRPEHAYESACDTHYKRGCLAVVSEQIKYTLLITAFGAAIIAIFQVGAYLVILFVNSYFITNFNMCLILQSLGLFCVVHLAILYGKHENGYENNKLSKKRQQQFLPLSIQDKRQDIPSPLSLSPTAPGHRVLKTSGPGGKK